MSKFDWKETLATVAPAIATALGGPLAGVAVKVASTALNISSSEEAIEAAIASGSPDVLVRLKEADHNFKQEMKRLDIQLEEINTRDRTSARELAKVKGLRPQIILSTIFLAGFILILYQVFGEATVIPMEMENAAMYLLGILSAGLTQIMNFFFGSSSGSKEKTAIMGLTGSGRARPGE